MSSPTPPPTLDYATPPRRTSAWAVIGLITAALVITAAVSLGMIWFNKPITRLSFTRGNDVDLPLNPVVDPVAIDRVVQATWSRLEAGKPWASRATVGIREIWKPEGPGTGQLGGMVLLDLHVTDMSREEVTDLNALIDKFTLDTTGALPTHAPPSPTQPAATAPK